MHRYHLPELNVVRRAMKQVRLSELADRTFLSEQALRLIRNGKRSTSPRYDTIYRIVAALQEMGVTVDSPEE